MEIGRSVGAGEGSAVLCCAVQSRFFVTISSKTNSFLFFLCSYPVIPHS